MGALQEAPADRDSIPDLTPTRFRTSALRGEGAEKEE